METHEKFVIREIPPPAVPWSGKYFWDKLSWKVAASTEDKTGRKPGEPAWTGKSQVIYYAGISHVAGVRGAV